MGWRLRVGAVALVAVPCALAGWKFRGHVRHEIWIAPCDLRAFRSPAAADSWVSDLYARLAARLGEHARH